MHGSVHAGLVPALVALALGAGCMTVQTPEPGIPVRLAEGEGIVFGQLRVFDRGIEFNEWKLEPGEINAEKPRMRLSLFHVESGRKAIDLTIPSDGRFEWIIPAGTYLLYHTPSIEPPYNEVLAAFQVSADSDPVDLGVLLLNISVDRPLSMDLATYSLLGVDELPPSAESAAWFRARHPDVTSIQPGVFIVDPALHRLFSNYSRAACARILSRHGIEIGDSKSP